MQSQLTLVKNRPEVEFDAVELFFMELALRFEDAPTQEIAELARRVGVLVRSGRVSEPWVDVIVGRRRITARKLIELNEFSINSRRHPVHGPLGFGLVGEGDYLPEHMLKFLSMFEDDDAGKRFAD